jgi:hypothetical protein
LSSCSKDDVIDLATSDASFTMTYDGVTYTDVDESSLILNFGAITAIASDESFNLMILGVGDDGSTVTITEESRDSSVILSFHGDELEDIFTAFSGTVTRSGNTIEVNVSGYSVSSLTMKTLTATINASQVLL